MVSGGKMKTSKVMKVLLGIGATAVGVYVGRMVVDDYMRHLDERKDAMELNGDHLARYSEAPFFPRGRRGIESLERSYSA